ncbi:MAG: hypothetical protein DSY80_05415 [Desulfocapsa sp.]|nr:MAG: hypothetical protein DSY80_05415 [Desulfocapsa sp.]
MRRIIGFAGRAEAGKTTAASYLETVHGFRHMNFATPLKEAASIMTGLPSMYFYNQDLKKQEIPWLLMSPRKFLQRLGTECVRDHIGKDFWVKRMQQEIDKFPDRSIVIGDIRFEEEASMVQSMGGIVVEIQRSNEKNPYGHSSEIIDFNCDVILGNTGTVEDLFQSIEIILEGVENE